MASISIRKPGLGRAATTRSTEAGRTVSEETRSDRRVGREILAADQILDEFNQVLGPHLRFLECRENIFPNLLCLEFKSGRQAAVR